MTSNDKKIYCVSTVNGMPCGILASWRSGQLSVVKVDTFPLAAANYKDLIAKEVSNRVKKGFLVFIEEGFQVVKVRGAYHIGLDTVDELSGGTVVNIAMKQYRAMSSSGLIVYGDTASNVTIPQSNINMVIDDKGRTVFQLEWAEIKPHHRAMLLVVYAVINNNPSHLPILKSMLASIKSSGNKAVALISSRSSSLTNHNQQKHRDFVEAQNLADINSDAGIPEGFTYVK
jgi:hypothetical protein